MNSLGLPLECVQLVDQGVPVQIWIQGGCGWQLQFEWCCRSGPWAGKQQLILVRLMCPLSRFKPGEVVLSSKLDGSCADHGVGLGESGFDCCAFCLFGRDLGGCWTGGGVFLVDQGAATECKCAEQRRSTGPTKFHGFEGTQCRVMVVHWHAQSDPQQQRRTP